MPDQDRATVSGERTRKERRRLAVWLTRPLRAWRRRADEAHALEHIDSTLLDRDGFWASESMGLDGAPSMATFSRRLSTNCACGSGAVMRSNGSSAKTTVPSGTACTSPAKRNVRDESEVLNQPAREAQSAAR